MTKITIELEVDMEKYDAHYGPGSEWWAKYGHTQKWDPITDKYVDVPEVYQSPNIAEMILEDFSELFHDWADKNTEEWKPWWRVKIDGVAQRKCCTTLENGPHKSYCESVAGPEASS